MTAATFWVGVIPGDKKPFRRAIRDKDGKIVRVLRFFDDAPLELDADELNLIRKDIGRVLCLMDPTDKTNTRFQVDWETTSKTFRELHGHEIPSRPNQPINVSIVDERKVIDRGLKNADDEPEEVVVDLRSELLDLIEKHIDKFIEATPEGVRLFLDNGGQLESLDGFTAELAQELRDALVTGPDLSRLVGAGIHEDIALKLAANVKVEGDEWLLDPDAIRTKLTEGYKLEDLDEIGKVAAKKIKAALGV
jgi:hypothetical protein